MLQLYSSFLAPFFFFSCWQGLTTNSTINIRNLLAGNSFKLSFSPSTTFLFLCLLPNKHNTTNNNSINNTITFVLEILSVEEIPFKKVHSSPVPSIPNRRNQTNPTPHKSNLSENTSSKHFCFSLLYLSDIQPSDVKSLQLAYSTIGKKLHLCQQGFSSLELFTQSYQHVQWYICVICISHPTPTTSDISRPSSCNHFAYRGNLVVLTSVATAKYYPTIRMFP